MDQNALFFNKMNFLQQTDEELAEQKLIALLEHDIEETKRGVRNTVTIQNYKKMKKEQYGRKIFHP